MVTELTGSVQKVMVMQGEGIQSTFQEQVEVTLEGFVGDRHAGLTAPAGSRQNIYPQDVEVRNTRQISVVSEEELAEVAQKMGIPDIQAEWIGANLSLSGIPSLTLLPSGTRLIFSQGVGLVVDSENLPCVSSGQSIQKQYPEVAGLATVFPKAAIHKRGVVAWVERSGVIVVGEEVRAIFPG
jgi:MOSC domain-containing protein YiiM